MKFLKYLVIFLAVIIVIIAILSFVAPTEVKVSRSITIDAPRETVWEYVNSLEDMHQWSPWAEKDPDMKLEYRGTKGKVGSVYSWDGDPETVGKGEQEITSIQAPSRIESELRFLTPYESKADAYVQLDETGSGSTRVTYGFESVSPRPMNVLNLFMNMDEMVGPDFEAAMSNLKKLVESGGSSGETQSEMAFR
ncbi:MAG: SRPBCC family protein [Christiangramia sp.]